MSAKTPGKEYERKFLARVDCMPRMWRAEASRIEQGYLALLPNQIRIRLKGGLYVVELKGPDDVEMELFHPEREQGDLLLRTIAPRVATLIVKDRYVVSAGFDGLHWEIDYFCEQNDPLVMIEIEMPQKQYPLEEHAWPNWVGEEVTGDARFANKNLATRPFASWPKSERKKILKLMGV